MWALRVLCNPKATGRFQTRSRWTNTQHQQRQEEVLTRDNFELVRGILNTWDQLLQDVGSSPVLVFCWCLFTAAFMNQRHTSQVKRQCKTKPTAMKSVIWKWKVQQLSHLSKVSHFSFLFSLFSSSISQFSPTWWFLFYFYIKKTLLKPFNLCIVLNTSTISLLLLVRWTTVWQMSSTSLSIALVIITVEPVFSVKTQKCEQLTGTVAASSYRIIKLIIWKKLFSDTPQKRMIKNNRLLQHESQFCICAI